MKFEIFRIFFDYLHEISRSDGVFCSRGNPTIDYVLVKDAGQGIQAGAHSWEARTHNAS